MATKNNDLSIVDVSGGYNDTDAPNSLPPDQCMVAENVEFVRSNLGERRLGAAAVTIAGSGLENKTHGSWLFRHLPTTDESASLLYAAAVTPATSIILCYKDTAWHTVTPTLDALGFAGKEGFQLSGQTLNQKLFIAHKSAVDRLHVVDAASPGSLRRVGLAAPTAAPTAADTGAGTFSGRRYYRVRETVQTAGVTVRRSEPSPVLTKDPSAGGTGLVVTKPADMGESATHWELEASLNNADFYRIATTVVGTATVTDSVAFGTGYAISGTLSADIGDYTVPISARFVGADNGRLLTAGSYEQTALSSRFSWSVVTGDLTGVGNDERVPLRTNNFLDIDVSDGGGFTNMSGSIGGYVYLAKQSHIYRAVRTGQVIKAYEVFPISKTIGALEGSFVEGVDQHGGACLYFLDLNTGPNRISAAGLRYCGGDIFGGTWSRISADATLVVTRAVFYKATGQVRWWIAVDGGNTPTLELVLQTDCMRDSDNGVRRGFSTATGLSATALSACLYSSNINANVARNSDLVPLMATTVGGAAAFYILDTGITDAGTVYRARVLSRPYFLGNLIDKFGALSAALFAKAAAGVSIITRAVRDFGALTNSSNVTTDLTPVSTEAHVVKLLDNFSTGEMRAVQVEWGDLDTNVTPAGTWELNQFVMKPRAEEEG